MKRVIIISTISLVIIIFAIMIASDVYYKRLERDYRVLMDTLYVEGVITDYKVNWSHAYLTLNDTMKIHVMPTTNKEYEIENFHELIEIGDTLFKGGDSDKIILKKGDHKFLFINQEEFGYWKH